MDDPKNTQQDGLLGQLSLLGSLTRHEEKFLDSPAWSETTQTGDETNPKPGLSRHLGKHSYSVSPGE